MFDEVEFLMPIATTVVLAGRKKQKKMLKLTLQVALVGGVSSVKVCLFEG